MLHATTRKGPTTKARTCQPSGLRIRSLQRIDCVNKQSSDVDKGSFGETLGLTRHGSRRALASGLQRYHVVKESVAGSVHSINEGVGDKTL